MPTGHIVGVVLAHP